MLLVVFALALLVLFTPQSSWADSPIKIGGYCLDTEGGHVFLNTCVADKLSQLWRWEHVDLSKDHTILGISVPQSNTARLLVNFQYRKCLDAWGAKLNSGDTVGIYACNHQHNQMWDTRDNSGIFEVGYWGKTAIKCLAVPEAKFTVRQRLIIWDCADKKKGQSDLRRRSQTFSASHLGTPGFQGLGNGNFCLESSGDEVSVAKCSLTTKPQQWWAPRERYFVPVMTGKWINLTAGQSAEKCLEVPDGNYADGTKLRMGACQSSAFRQTFYLKGLVQLPLPMKHLFDVGKDGKCMAVDPGWEAGAKLLLRKCDESDVKQKFEIFENLSVMK